jgi:transmembrane sensor
MTRSKDFDAAMVARYLSGESTPAESALVDAWIASDPGKRAEFDEIRRAWSASFPLERSIDVDKAWARTVTRMHGSERATPAPAHAEHALVLHTAPVRSDAFADEKPRRSRRHPIGAFRLMHADRSIGLRAAAAAVVLAGAGVASVQLAARLRDRDVPARTTREFVAAAGQRAIIDLDDGTHIVLAPSSHLRMSMPVRGNGLREAVLDGEAMFTVAHDTARPFVVRSRYGNTVDIGTAFAVRAYSNEPYRVSVREGQVALDQLTPKDSHRSSRMTGGVVLDASAPVLVAGDVATRSNDGRITIAHGQDVAQMLDWTSGRLTFDHEPFAELVPDLERWYGVDIRIESPVLRTRTVTGQFDTESKTEAFNALGRVLGARHRVDGRRVTFYLR